MIPYLVLLLAALSRFLPHAFHGQGLNITAVTGGLLFFGSLRPKSQALIAAAVMGCTDVLLTRYVYGYPFHLHNYLITWIWYGVVCLIGGGILQRVTILRVAAAVVVSSTGFFIWSNAAVWLGGDLYPHSAAGLRACYVAALPFYGNDLVSTALTAGVLFVLPMAATQLVSLLQGASEQHPAA